MAMSISSRSFTFTHITFGRFGVTPKKTEIVVLRVGSRDGFLNKINKSKFHFGVLWNSSLLNKFQFWFTPAKTQITAIGIEAF